ncbi:MAG: hypothetical protein JWN00_951 [Actinomycetia bacterium]|nr:hypothetical protein [Actinomycetes bacterium]
MTKAIGVLAISRVLPKTIQRALQSVPGLGDGLRGGGAARPGWGLARVGSYALAISVHMFTLALAVGAVVVMWVVRDLRGILLGLFLLVIVFLIRPRLGRVPKRAVTLSRETAPEPPDSRPGDRAKGTLAVSHSSCLSLVGRASVVVLFGEQPVHVVAVEADSF